MRAGSVVAVVVALTALGGCGGDDGKKYDAGEVIDHFKSQTGDLLIRDSDAPPTWDLLGFGDSADESTGGLTPEASDYADKYGAFSLYVVKQDVDSTVKDLTTGEDDDADVDETVDPKDEESGIVWTKTCYRGELAGSGCSYSAAKQYGKNVVLRWQGEATKETDSTFDRIDSVLQDLPG